MKVFLGLFFVAKKALTIFKSPVFFLLFLIVFVKTVFKASKFTDLSTNIFDFGVYQMI